ncbi:hypothetical protein MJO57_07390 [Endozoicomonas sp. SCSIO W0465]|nr:hypothetical protein [Endozoicomonas sp. SCSIO W0465]USE37995.1 hypothetical protein MJO57_07390 [Endozoicomonas sp. SCSIO W0465]
MKNLWHYLFKNNVRPGNSKIFFGNPGIKLLVLKYGAGFSHHTVHIIFQRQCFFREEYTIALPDQNRIIQGFPQLRQRPAHGGLGNMHLLRSQGDTLCIE